MPRGRSLTVQQPAPTGDASQWFSRLSGYEPTATWYDISASGSNGTANNAGACLADYYFRGGAVGAGADDIVTTAYAGDVTLATESWSVEMWYTRDGDEHGQVTLSGCRASGPNGGWILRENGPTAPAPLTFDTFQPGWYPVNNVLPDIIGGSWGFIAITWEANITPGTHGKFTTYFNGLQYFTATVPNFGAGDVFDIGGSTHNRWTGYIDTNRIFSRVLSPDEILRDYHAGMAAHPVGVGTEGIVSQYLPSGQTPTTWADVTDGNSMTGNVTAPPVFDGDDYYTIGNPANLQFGTNFSIEVWASQDPDASQGYERLVSRDDGGNRCFAMSQADDSGNPYAAIFIGGGFFSAGGTNDYADGNWHHYVATHDGVTLKLYVDSVLEASVAAAGTMDNDPVPWQVGRYDGGGGSDYLEGRCDTVRFYSNTLGLYQIELNYNAGLAAHT